MKIHLRAFVLAFSVAAQVSSAGSADSGSQEQKPMTTVQKVDLQRYVGLWHEIARIPNRFQKNCDSGTTAQYELREDGRIDVINQCLEEDGSVDRAEGVAKIVDANTNAKLKVSFVSFLGWRPFWGDYWILGLDDDYQWAIVGSPDRKYGWILARTPELDEDILERIFAILTAQGYDTDRFAMNTAR
jgi:apolipoprotein D and lipocalin family protein